MHQAPAEEVASIDGADDDGKPKHDEEA